MMRVALYARVSTERQEKERTIESQVDALRNYAQQHGHGVVELFVCRDDGQSGARLDRPGLDRLRDGAREGLFDAVLVLCPDRLARKYVHQVLILEELEKWGVRVIFLEQPLTDDPQAQLLVQIQGAVAEYERAKITERSRRGKLYRARQGEVLAWRVPYGYRRVPKLVGAPAHLEVFEPEAAVLRQIFQWHVEERLSMRALAKRLTVQQVPTPHGDKSWWATSTIHGMLHDEAYIGSWHVNRHEASQNTDPRSPNKGHTMTRDRQDWITLTVPPIVDADLFQRSQQVHTDNSCFSPRHLSQPWWLLRCLVRCGRCHMACRCHRLRTGAGKFTCYYRCKRDHAFVALEERCSQRHIRADALDAFVWDKVRDVFHDPAVLLQASSGGGYVLPDEAYGAQAQIAKRQLGQVHQEERRLLDAYQAGLIPIEQLQQRLTPLHQRAADLEREAERLEQQHAQAHPIQQLRRNVGALSAAVSAGLDQLSFSERQEFLRLIIERVEVKDWTVTIAFRIPLPPDHALAPLATTPGDGEVSTNFALRSLRRRESQSVGWQSLASGCPHPGGVGQRATYLSAASP